MAIAHRRGRGLNLRHTIRNVLVSLLLALPVLTGCSAQEPQRDPQGQQEGTGAPAPTRSESVKGTLETAGTATMVVVVLGVGLAAVALPVLLVVLLL